MKRMTASEARRNWFRVLDEVIAGEVVIIERKGRRVVLRREGEEESMGGLPDYAALIAAKADIEGADGWGWEWDPDSGELTPGDAGDA